MWCDWPWQPAADYAELEPSLGSWLLSQDSMTRRLRAHSRSFHVQLLAQEPVSEPLPNWLALPAPVVQRTVLLHADAKPCIFAQTLGSAEALRHLGEQPLGDRLFGQDAWHRGPLLLTQVMPEQLPRGLATAPLWARCSAFHHQDKAPLWVMEAFLPAIYRLQRSTTTS